MATSLGKELRKIRIEEDENLCDMAEKLSISPAMLSSIENGNRKMSDETFQRLVSAYHIPEEKKEEMMKMVLDEKKDLKIDLTSLNHSQRDTAQTLARNLYGLSDEKCEEINKILKGGK